MSIESVYPEALVSPETIPDLLERYSRDTLGALLFMANTRTGLPRDRIQFCPKPEITQSNATTPSNIGLYLADLVAARDIGFLDQEKMCRRMKTVLDTIDTLENYYGLYLNWYDVDTSKPLHVHPSGGIIKPFISTIDNAWLAAGLMTVRSAVPEYRVRADRLLHYMDFSRLYDNAQNFFFGGCDLDQDKYPSWHYDVLGTEARIATYLGISEFGIPRTAFEQLKKNRHTKNDIILSWGGSMFEACMPPLFVPEDLWSKAWEKSHREYIQQQINKGQKDTLGFWGLTPCDTTNGYMELGDHELALFSEGYRDGPYIPPYGSALAIHFAKLLSVLNLFRIEISFEGAYRDGYGFVESVNPFTGEITPSILFVDHSMTFISMVNELTHGGIRNYLGPQLEKSIRPLLETL